MRSTILLLLLLAARVVSFAQQQAPPFTCANNDPRIMEALHHNDPEAIQAIADANDELEEFTQNFPEGARSTYVMPVVFHIIHNNGAENINDDQIYDAVRILNEDFNKMNSDWQNVRSEFLGLVADVSIEFRLARKDPQGNCTRGITRTVSTLTNDGTQAMKDLIQWPRNKYLNVWVAASADGAAGYTLTPGSVQLYAAADGIVILHTYVGAIGTSSPGRSRALTHEIGHWINLAHTWGGTNTPAVSTNCNSDDNVSDTPNTIGWTSCNLNGNTCGSLDNVENFMDYSYCSKMFTTGQKSRMIAALNSGTAQRNQLTTTSNLTSTGVNQPEVLCAAVFSSTNRVICAGGSVDFSDDSYNVVASRTWSFSGGTPSSSTSATPSITYTEPGVYPVTLTASDGSNSLTNTQNSYVTVLASPGQALPVIEGFENVTALNGPDWFTMNQNNDNTFTVTSTTAYTGTKSVRILNTAAMAGTADQLMSKTFDMSGATEALISFRYAYAKRTSTNDDALRISVSNNCGLTWSLRKIMRGSTNLTTGGVVTGSFTPNGASQWGYSEVTNITSSYFVPNFRLMFEFESDGGNNLYIDDININGQPVGIEELAGNSAPMVVVPNPAADAAQVVFDVQRAGPVRLELLDMTGRLVEVIHDGQMGRGAQRVELNASRIQPGIYFIRNQQGAEQQVARFVVR